MKNNGTKNSIKLNCLECNEVYHKSKSLAKNSKFCSRVCQNRNQASRNKRDRKTIECLSCNDKIEVADNSKRKYCSSKCFNKASRVDLKDFECKVCKNIFQIKINDKRQYCGRDCQYKAQSLGLIKIPTNGRSGYRIDLPGFYFKSSLEADYARYLIYHNIDFEYEPKCFTLDDNGRTRRYTPDFYIVDKDLYIETKARRSDKKYESNLQCVQLIKNLGYNIKVIYMNKFYENLKKENEYEKIPNLERRDYKGTRKLLRD